jgi:hypothetical protein
MQKRTLYQPRFGILKSFSQSRPKKWSYSIPHCFRSTREMLEFMNRVPFEHICIVDPIAFKFITHTVVQQQIQNPALNLSAAQSKIGVLRRLALHAPFKCHSYQNRLIIAADSFHRQTPPPSLVTCSTPRKWISAKTELHCPPTQTNLSKSN